MLEQTGGELDEPGYLMVEEFKDERGLLVDVLIGQQELHFYDGRRFAFRVRVTHEGVVEDYRYHLMQADGTAICRLDKHPGHEHEVGGLSHMHIGPGVRRNGHRALRNMTSTTRSSFCLTKPLVQSSTTMGAY